MDSAFLNGRYLDADRKLYFRAPKGGFPAVPELGWDYIPEGTILKAKKGGCTGREIKVVSRSLFVPRSNHEETSRHDRYPR